MRKFFICVVFFSACHSVKNDSVEVVSTPKLSHPVQEQSSEMPFYAIGPVGILNGTEITAFQFNTAMKKSKSKACLGRIKKYFLRGFFITKVMELDSDGRLDQVSSEDVDRRYAKLSATLQDHGASMANFLEISNRAEANLRLSLRRELVIRSSFPSIFKRLEDKIVRAEYEADLGNYMSSPEIKGTFFSIANPDKATLIVRENIEKATKALYSIVANKGASASSIRSEVAKVSLATGVEIFVDALENGWPDTYYVRDENLKAGVFPLETNEGFQVVSIQYFYPSAQLPFEKVEAKIRRKMEQSEDVGFMEEYFAKRMVELGIEIFYDNLVDSQKCKKEEAFSN